MNSIAELLIALYVRAKAQSGQTALEYIGIAVGLAFMVAVGFQLAGADVFGSASNLVKDVLGRAAP